MNLRRIALAACLLALAGPASAKQAPEFPAGMQWLNTEKPLPLSSLRGKLVLLDFWTFCCINCMHILPDLHQLEEKYKNELVVVGVHSAKFTAEQAGDKISKAIQRFKITHPVLNDNNSKVWDLYGVQAWPTLVLIAPDGEILESVPGEEAVGVMGKAIEAAVKKYSAQLKRKPMVHRLEASKAKAANLAFPGKVLADAKGQRLIVADSGHDRIVVASLGDGKLMRVVLGFKNPQGLALSEDGQKLYVCDLGANAVKSLDLRTGDLTTLAEGLNSPWDLCLLKGSLYIAMAGSHQIWRLDLKTKECRPWAGNGREDLLDAALKEANFAQPSGICSDGDYLYSADSESSSIRKISGTEVTTLTGKGLFKFGDGVGACYVACLQHPLGVHFYGGQIYVADTFNGLIKTVDPHSGEVKGVGPIRFDLLGLDTDGLDEPGGLWISGGKVYIADTNHHRIVTLDLASKAVRIFDIRGL